MLFLKLKNKKRPTTNYSFFLIFKIFIISKIIYFLTKFLKKKPSNSKKLTVPASNLLCWPCCFLLTSNEPLRTAANMFARFVMFDGNRPGPRKIVSSAGTRIPFRSLEIVSRGLRSISQIQLAERPATWTKWRKNPTRPNRRHHNTKINSKNENIQIIYFFLCENIQETIYLFWCGLPVPGKVITENGLNTRSKQKKISTKKKQNI